MPPPTRDRSPTDRPTVKADARKVTFYLPEGQWREFRAQMARKGESSTSRFLVDALALDAPSAGDGASNE